MVVWLGVAKIQYRYLENYEDYIQWVAATRDMENRLRAAPGVF